MWKIKIWDKKEKRMKRPTSLNFDSRTGELHSIQVGRKLYFTPFKTIIPMLWSMVVDKYDRPIYEEDIVGVLYKGKVIHVSRVIWHRGSFCLAPNDPRLYILGDHDSDQLILLGNTYSDKGLFEVLDRGVRSGKIKSETELRIAKTQYNRNSAYNELSEF